LFDNEVAPSGYLTITPGMEFHSIYSVSWSEFDYAKLLARTEKAFEVPWIRRILGTSRWVGKIHGRAHYLRDPIATAERGGSLYVGEAGGFQDAVAGFGFRYAAMTGALAAKTVCEGLDYRELLRQAFGPEFEDAFAFRQKFQRATNDDYDAMIASLGAEITLEEYVLRREARGF
jgi:flavin-dependent dehydrogenase